MKGSLSHHRLVLLLCIALLLGTGGASAGQKDVTAIEAPVLKWQGSGCYTWGCETGWYASPAVADLDGDGAAEVIGASYHIVVVDGASGALEWRVASGHDRSEPDAEYVGRTWPGVVVADVDGNGDLEIVTSHGGGYVSVYNHDGYFYPGWPKRPIANELRGLAVYDLDGDGDLEIVVSGFGQGRINTWVYEHDGTLCPGWPQLDNDSGYASDVFNQNVAAGDVDGDGVGELIVPSDVHYICAYERDGVQLPANATSYGDKAWGKVGVWESLEIEERGWGDCESNRAERYRTNFAHGASVIADVNGDGVMEVIAVGNVYDCAVGHPPGKYNGVYVFNADRSRFKTGGWDWETPPVETGAPLSEDYGVIENNQPNPVVVDLDGDGRQEILFSSYDGRVHAYWLDKAEHGAWPYSVYNAAEGIYRFASEPAVADLDADGHAEVIVASWPQHVNGKTGKLHVLDYHGNLLHELDLPVVPGTWNGGLAAPTLANIDGDAELEVVLNTVKSGLVAYDLPGTANARVLWATGRGNDQRTGSALYGSLERSRKSVTPARAGAGEVLTYTIVLDNPGPALPAVRLTDTLPAGVEYVGNLWASSGSFGQAGGVISWTGQVPAAAPVTLIYAVRASDLLTVPHAIANTALIDDGVGNLVSRQVVTIVNGWAVYLPLVLR